MLEESTRLISVQQSHQASQGAQGFEAPHEKNILMPLSSSCLRHQK